jgi:hypothetical protein
VLSNLAQIPFAFPSSRAAVTAAYKSTYEDYHGFFVKQIFQNSFDAAPEAREILCYMNLPATTDIETVPEVDDWSDVADDDMWVQFPVESWSEKIPESTHTGPKEPQKRPPPALNNNNPVGIFLEQHWTKLQNLIGQCVGVQVNSNPSRNVMEAQQLDDPTTAGGGGGGFFSKEVWHTVDNVIPSYISVMQPLLDSIERLIEEFNMNDPTKI